MKKKILVIIISIILVFAAVLLYFFAFRHKGQESQQTATEKAQLQGQLGLADNAHREDDSSKTNKTEDVNPAKNLALNDSAKSSSSASAELSWEDFLSHLSRRVEQVVYGQTVGAAKSPTGENMQFYDKKTASLYQTTLLGSSGIELASLPENVQKIVWSKGRDKLIYYTPETIISLKCALWPIAANTGLNAP